MEYSLQINFPDSQVETKAMKLSGHTKESFSKIELSSFTNGSRSIYYLLN